MPHVVIVVVSFFFIFPGSSFAQDTTEVPRPRAKPAEGRWNLLDLKNYPPETPKFSESLKTAQSYSNAEWRAMDHEERGRYIYETAQAIIKEHNLTYHHGLSHSPRVLTCKAYHESMFEPQWETPVETSTAAGLSQVTVTTLNDLFDRGNWFRSKIKGFEHISDGKEFREKMVSSLPAQIEIGLAILQQKSRDFKTTDKGAKPLLRLYLGSGNDKEDEKYANLIYSCAECLLKENSGSVKMERPTVTQTCLNCAKKKGAQCP